MEVGGVVAELKLRGGVDADGMGWDCLERRGERGEGLVSNINAKLVVVRQFDYYTPSHCTIAPIAIAPLGACREHCKIDETLQL